MEKKLALISLRDPYLDNDRVMPPLWIMSLYSYITSKGIKTVLENDFDLNNLWKYKDITHFGVSCMTPQKKQALEILQAVKSLDENKKVIIWWPHTKFYLNECIDHPYDYIVRGDWEYALEKILCNTWDTVSRILEMPISTKDMNSFPLPYREPSFLKQYNFNIQWINSTTILTSKWCPMSCAFCEDANSKPKYYSPEVVWKQIKESKMAGFEWIMFFDDLFAINTKRVEELTNEIKKHNVKYRCFWHAKTMKENMVVLLKESGCIEIWFWAESWSQKILDNINKRVNVEQNFEFVKLCNKYWIKVKAFIMIGLPWEDQSTLNETEKFIDFLTKNTFTNSVWKEITNDFDLTVYYPYQGTKIRDSIDAWEEEYDLIIDKDDIETSEGYYKWKWGSSETTVRTKELSSNDLVNIKEKFFDEYKKRVIL